MSLSRWFNRTETLLQDDALPCKLSMFKIQDDSNLFPTDPKEVQHLPSLFISDGFDGFCIGQNLVLDLQVRNKLIDLLAPIKNRVMLLLGVADSLKSKFHAQGTLVGFFAQAVSQPVNDGEGTSHDSVDQFLLNQFSHSTSLG